jgi:ankyrin repeat protein
VQALQQAASRDDAAGVTSAVNQGVFVDARDGQDMTALMLAARAGATHAVDALLQAGANLGLRDLNDNTALMYAVQTKHVDVAMRLLDAGAGGNGPCGGDPAGADGGREHQPA